MRRVDVKFISGELPPCRDVILKFILFWEGIRSIWIWISCLSMSTCRSTCKNQKYNIILSRQRVTIRLDNDKARNKYINFQNLFSSIVDQPTTQMQNQVQQFGIEAIAYEQLEGQFQEVLMSLSSDQTLDRFRVEYQKIHRALKHSHEQEKKLLGKCRQLSKDIIAGAAKLQSALKFSNDDSHTISYLKAQVAKTYKYLELSREHEELSKQKIQKLKAEMKRLHMMMQQNDSITQGQVASVHEYTIANEELQKEKEILQISLESNKTELQQIKTKIDNSEMDKQKLRRNYQELKKRKEVQEIKVKEEEQNKRLKKDQLQVIKTQFDNAKNDQSNSKVTRKQLKIRYKELDSQLYEIEINMEKEKKTLKKLKKDEAIENKKLQQVEQLNANLAELTRQRQKELQNIRFDISKEKDKQSSLKKISGSIQDQISQLKAEKDEIQKLKETINLGLMQLQTQINEEKKHSSKDKSFIEKMKRDRDMHKKELQRSDANNKQIYEEIINKEKVLKEKENQLFGQKKEIEKLNKAITALEKQRDANSFQATSAQAKYFYARDEVKLRDNFIAEFQKQNMETEAKLKKQQSLYEAVRSDRTLVSKKLAEIQEQKLEYQNRYRRVTHQITQLKQQIDTKEADLVKQHNQHKKKDKKIQDQEKKISKYEKDVSEKDEKIKNYKIQIEKLRAIIKETTYQQQKLQQEYQLVVSERDILGTQLIKRSAQADLLYEKIKINQSALTKGQVQYNQKIIDIETQKQDIASLMNDIKSYKTQNSAIIDLKAEIHNLSRQLTESKLKAKALSEQIQNPMNVHRWRKLEATDSATYELMTKIQSIQKRLIGKTEEVKKKEAALVEKEKQLQALQQVLKRQPSIQEQKMIPVYEDNLQQKHRQIAAMKEQIQNYEETMSEFSIELERLQKELQNYKKKFFFQKKRQQQNKEEKKTQEDYIKVILPDKRMTGGGFNLAI